MSAANQSVAGTSSTAEKSIKSPPIKTRTEKQERLVRLLRESLSRKISEKSEKLKDREKEVEEEEEEEGNEIRGSESPASTLSSSGERERGYSLFVDPLDSADESGEYHMIITC